MTLARFQQRPIAAILFDLDGTLLDTVHDIALALQRALAERGLQGPPPEAVRQMIGQGAPMLVERADAALGLALPAPAKAAVLDRFFHHYGELQANDEIAAQPFPGALEGLRALQAAGLPLAIVTNKYERFARGLAARIGFGAHVRLIVGGDTCARRKPDPLPLLHAAQQLGVDAAQTLMVGDSVNDVKAARAAAMPVVCVPYGYNEGADPRTLPCDAFVERIDELPRLLGLGGP